MHGPDAFYSSKCMSCLRDIFILKIIELVKLPYCSRGLVDLGFLDDSSCQFGWPQPPLLWAAVSVNSAGFRRPKYEGQSPAARHRAFLRCSRK